MNYSVYSYVALSPLRQGGAPNPAAEPRREVEAQGLKFAGTARVVAPAASGTWYARLWHRFFGPVAAAESKVDFEVVLNIPAEIRSGLGLATEHPGAVIEIHLTQIAAQQ